METLKILGEIIFVVIALGFILFRVTALLVLTFGWKSAMRQKYPLDYLYVIGWVVRRFESVGFKKGDYIDPGTDFPGVYMALGNTTVSIMLKADKNPYKIYCLDSNGGELFSISDEQTETNEQEVDRVISSLSGCKVSDISETPESLIFSIFNGTI